MRQRLPLTPELRWNIILNRQSVFLIILIFHYPGLHFLIHWKLISYHCPIRDRTPIPFFIQLRNPQIQCFPDSVFAGKGSFLCHLTETGVYSLQGICGIHCFPYGTPIIEQLLNMRPVSYPRIYCPGIATPGLFKAFKLCLRSSVAGTSIYFF